LWTLNASTGSNSHQQLLSDELMAPWAHSRGGIMRVSFQINWPVAILVMIATAVCVSTDICAQGAQPLQNAKPAISLSIAPVEPSVRAGSKVLVDVTQENISDHHITSGGRLGGDGFEYPMDVWDEKGATPPPKQNMAVGRTITGLLRTLPSILGAYPLRGLTSSWIRGSRLRIV